MSTPPVWARGFSCPQEGLDLDAAAAIATTYASAYCGTFLDVFGEALEAVSSGLLPVLERWPERENEFEDVWDVSLGYTRRTVLDDDRRSARQQASALALRLHMLGEPGEWEARLDEPVRLRMNRWLLPKTRSLAVSADGRRIEVRLGANGSGPHVVEFERRGSSWAAEGAEALPSIRAYGCAITLLPEPALDGLSFGGELSLSRLSPAQILTKVRSSLRVLRDHAPVYLPWTQNVLRAVIPLHAQLSEIRSGSDLDKPGVVQASFPIRTLALAETWVHECSHQYFQILTRVEPVDDGSDPTLYYSPVRQTGRPLDKILLAYHAFANVLLFYRACRESGLEGNPYLELNELRLVPQLRQLEGPLHETRALTGIGRALWEPLAERIAL
jgi:HEXXH motif-containing protein